MKPIARIHSDFPEKFGVPRQSGLCPSSRARIVFEEEYRSPEALRGLEGFDYIWLIWEFSCNGPRWQPTVRPPRLGGNARMGVFATRSTFRPNSLGLSSVRLERIDLDTPDGPVIEVSGADLVDGTPIYDIKPYVTYADSHPDAASGWVDQLPERRLKVLWAFPAPEAAAAVHDAAATPEAPAPEAAAAVHDAAATPEAPAPETAAAVHDAAATPEAPAPEAGAAPAASDHCPPGFEALGEILSLDPRPSYIDDSEREYGMSWRGLNVRFRVEGDTLTVLSVG